MTSWPKLKDNETNCEKNKRALLRLAASDGYEDICQALIETGIDLDVRDQVSQDLKICFPVLRRSELTSNVEPKRGDNALHLAIEKIRPKISQMLIEHGADLNALDKVGLV